MKGIITLIIILLVVLGIWWARRTPDPVTTGFRPGPVSGAEIDDTALDPQEYDVDSSDFEDKG